MKPERVFYEYDGMFYSKSPEWEFLLYLFKPNAMGNVINNTGKQSIERNETKHLVHMFDLLKLHIRWPDECNEWGGDRIAKNRWVWEWSKWKRAARRLNRWMLEGGPIKQVTEVDQVLFRPQGGETRDDYTWSYAAAILLNRKDFIHIVRSPWWLFSPTYAAWVRYLRTGRGAKTYLRRELRRDSKLAYVGRLKEVRLKAFYHAKETIWND